MMYLGGKLKPLLSVFRLIICLVTVLIAQDISGTIGGTILDPSGAMVPGAKVTITNTDRNQVLRTITTDPTGAYSAPLIPVGQYSVKVEVKGFKTETRTAIALNVSDDLKINIILQVGSMTDVVTVEASALSVELGPPPAPTPLMARRCASCPSPPATTSSWLPSCPAWFRSPPMNSTSATRRPPVPPQPCPSTSTATATPPTTGPWMAPITWIAAATSR